MKSSLFSGLGAKLSYEAEGVVHDHFIKLDTKDIFISPVWPGSSLLTLTFPSRVFKQ